MDFSNVDPVAFGLLTFAVVGFVQFVRSLFEKDWKAALIILTSGVAGAIFAPYAGAGISWFVGMLIGFNASGVITTVSRVASFNN